MLEPNRKEDRMFLNVIKLIGGGIGIVGLIYYVFLMMAIIESMMRG